MMKQVIKNHIINEYDLHDAADVFEALYEYRKDYEKSVRKAECDVYEMLNVDPEVWFEVYTEIVKEINEENGNTEEVTGEPEEIQYGHRPYQHIPLRNSFDISLGNYFDSLGHYFTDPAYSRLSPEQIERVKRAAEKTEPPVTVRMGDLTLEMFIEFIRAGKYLRNRSECVIGLSHHYNYGKAGEETRSYYHETVEDLYKCFRMLTKPDDVVSVLDQEPFDIPVKVYTGEYSRGQFRVDTFMAGRSVYMLYGKPYCEKWTNGKTVTYASDYYPNLVDRVDSLTDAYSDFLACREDRPIFVTPVARENIYEDTEKQDIPF